MGSELLTGRSRLSCDCEERGCCGICWERGLERGDGREVKPSKGREDPRGMGGEEEKPNMVVVAIIWLYAAWRLRE